MTKHPPLQEVKLPLCFMTHGSKPAVRKTDKQRHKLLSTPNKSTYCEKTLLSTQRQRVLDCEA